jgi:hypothetical protein
MHAEWLNYLAMQQKNEQIIFGAITKTLNTEILVIGGGSAGCTAALASAGSKYTVTLVERYGFPGGTSTQMLDTFYGFFSIGDSPRKIAGGYPDIVVSRLDETGDIFLRPNTYGAGTGVTYNPERLKAVWDNLLTESGVRLFYHTLLVGVEDIAEGSSCIFYHKGWGFFRINAKRIIDASGDADYCYLAGLPYEKAGENEPVQSMTTTFRMANVDWPAFIDAGGKEALKKKMAEAVDSGVYKLPRREGSIHEMSQPGCASTVAVKVTGLDPSEAGEMTEAEIEGRRQAFIYENFFRNEVPGFGESRIIGLSNQIGVRETRRVYGIERLTLDDCMNTVMPANRILLCGAPLEDHRKGEPGMPETFWKYIPGTGVYGVPYGTIVPQNSKIAWVAGRCFSATHDAHSSCRSMAQTMSMGQAAGLAAVLSLDNDSDASGIDVEQLQENLVRVGSVLDIPGRIADTGRHGWKNNFV